MKKAQENTSDADIKYVSKETAKQFAAAINDEKSSATQCHLDFVSVPDNDIEWVRVDERVSQESMKLKVTLNSKQRSISLERKLTPTSREKTKVEFKFREILGIKI